MIHHLSIAARDPKHAAEVLAELMGGTAVPFPPNPGSFFALQLDEHGSGVEVFRREQSFSPAAPLAALSSRRTRVAMDRRISRSASQPLRPVCRRSPSARDGNASTAIVAHFM